MPHLKIFLSYRREQAAADAGRLHDLLRRELGPTSVFIDVDNIPLGTNFVKHLNSQLQGCDALLAVIGPNWLDARDEHGNRRLDDPNDFVRMELAGALQRDIPVVPILLGGTKIPPADQLPSDLQELSFRSGLDLRHSSFDADVSRLVQELKQLASSVSKTPVPVVNKVANVVWSMTGELTDQVKAPVGTEVEGGGINVQHPAPTISLLRHTIIAAAITAVITTIVGAGLAYVGAAFWKGGLINMLGGVSVSQITSAEDHSVPTYCGNKVPIFLGEAKKTFCALTDMSIRHGKPLTIDKKGAVLLCKT